MGRRAYLFSVGFIFLVISAYPLYQMFSTGGYLFYQNAFDEATYLQYDYSRLDGNITRPTQFVVTLAHRAGLSGGWINFTLDTICLIFFPLIYRKVFIKIGHEPKVANVMSILAMLLPGLFGGLNPIVAHLFNWCLGHGWLYWVSLPEAWYLPIMRSPEPQLSLVLLGLFLLLSLRMKKYWPLYLSLPFLYAYVALPVLFVVLGSHLCSIFKNREHGKWWAPIASFSVVCFLVWFDIQFLLSPVKREMFVRSRLPMVSLTSCVALLIYFIFKENIEKRFRYAAFLTAVAPFFLLNQQVLTGWFFHPVNYEQYSGILCATFVLLLSIGRSRLFQMVALAFSFLLVIDLGLFVFHHNQGINQKVKWTPELAEALRSSPERVAVNDVELASQFSMVFPKEPLTLFSYQQIFPKLAPSHFRNYVCAKNEILGNSRLNGKYNEVFKRLDQAYRYTGNDFWLIHVGRKSVFKAKYDADIKPVDCPRSDLFYVLTDGK